MTPEVLLGGGAGRKACLTQADSQQGGSCRATFLSKNPGPANAGVAVLVAGAPGGSHPGT